MMNVLLKRLRDMTLTMATCEALLLRAAKLAVIREITLDDWVYLAHLIAYRATTRGGANDEEKAVIARTMRKIAEEKNGLDSMFN